MALLLCPSIASWVCPYRSSELSFVNDTKFVGFHTFPYWVSFAPASPDSILLLWPLLTFPCWVFILCHIRVPVPSFHAWLLLASLQCRFWSSLCLGPSLCSDLPNSTTPWPFLKEWSYPWSLLNFISTLPHVALELPKCFRWMSFRYLEMSRTGFLFLQTYSYHIRCHSDRIILQVPRAKTSELFSTSPLPPVCH